MGGGNRGWQHSSSNPRPPPHLYPGYYHANNKCPVPLWERKFCSFVGSMFWQRLGENKNLAYMDEKIEQWDDSAAFQNFQNANSRFWSHYNGKPSDILLPDPDLYIEKVDHHCKIDPELVADLEKGRLSFEADNEFAVAANNKSRNQSGSWDVYVEKPADVNKWEENNSRSNMGWVVKHDQLNSWNKIIVQPSWGSSSNNHCATHNWNSFHGASTK